MKPLLALIIVAAQLPGQQTPNTQPQDEQIIPLWSGQAPGAQGKDEPDIPTITVYPTRTAPRPGAPGLTAVIVCPGGSYVHLAMNHEGRQVANYLNSLGIFAVVLKYRLGPRYHHPIEIGDAQRAIRLLRAKAADWGIASDRVGIMGFSAGGHLASSASTHFDAGKTDAADPIDRLSSRPDFAVLGYPVISLSAAWTHQGSKDALLGKNPDPELAKSLSGELAVTARTPPTFIFQTNGDTTVPAENAVYYYLALRKAGVAAEMHVFQRGPHGVGLGGDDFALAQWPGLLANWLRVHSLLK
jgi:acetyl esterase/lipase